MELKELTKKALENAFSADISRLYSVLTDAITAAKDNEEAIKNAIGRFKKGIDVAKNVYESAMTAAGL